MKSICYCFFLLIASNVYAQGWLSISPMPGGAHDAGFSFSIGNIIYAGGSTISKSFYAYDPSTKQWTKKKDIPGVIYSRGFGIGFAINGKGYVGLGDDDSTLLGDLWQYDPAADSWTRKADYIVGPRNGLGVFVIGHKAYVGGGSDNNYEYSEFCEYDADSDTWTRKQDLPQSDGDIFPGMFSLGVYGYTIGGEDSVEHKNLYRYDPSMDSWDEKADFPDQASQAAVAFTIGNKAYYGLGQSGYDTTYSCLYSYDATVDQWQKEEALPSTGVAWSTAAVLGDTVYIGNGSFFRNDSLLVSNGWWIYSPAIATASVKVENAPALLCYPLPATNAVTISGIESGETYTISIVDALGKTVQRSLASATGNALTFDIATLSTGAYEVLLVSDNAHYTISLIKQ